MKIAIIVPAFNEESTIRDVISSFHHELPNASMYVIDNNSFDKTNQIVQRALAELNCKGRVLTEKKQGKASAVRRAFNEINADVYILVDADMTYPADAIHELIKPIVDGEADMVVGDRHKTGGYNIENKQRFHNFGNKLVRILINYLFKSKLNDILSGYRVFNRKFVKNFPIMKEGFALETELTLHALDKRFRIKEIPIRYKDRPIGSVSKINTLMDGVKIIKVILMIFKDYKPVVFFSAASLFFCLLGLATGIPVVIEFIHTRFVSHIPLAILATGLMLFSMIAFTVGIILDTVAENHRFQYELMLLQFLENQTQKNMINDFQEFLR